jgi:hypothetical protein
MTKIIGRMWLYFMSNFLFTPPICGRDFNKKGGDGDK